MASITIAPADYQLLVDNRRYALSVDAPVGNARPSIDVLFESVAEKFGTRAMGVLLTGGGKDGVRGLEKIRQRNGAVLIECPSTAEDGSLPAAAIEAGTAKAGFPLDELAAQLLGQCS